MMPRKRLAQPVSAPPSCVHNRRWGTGGGKAHSPVPLTPYRAVSSLSRHAGLAHGTTSTVQCVAHHPCSPPPHPPTHPHSHLPPPPHALGPAPSLPPPQKWVTHQAEQRAATSRRRAATPAEVALRRWSRVAKKARSALKRANPSSVLQLELQLLEYLEVVWGCGCVWVWGRGEGRGAAALLPHCVCMHAGPRARDPAQRGVGALARGAGLAT